ncbi:hypothetical protein [Photorhabdus heterorhabditis]|uniref:hypothetical protein n=1 Tax=Photorhabdus heterorhabditis TaxID=880156 RepID=UPI001562CBAA|nr:hypothetical protein [Photorhabdus heterorhabditis]NRN28446.1 hypothetical protein [Photorhabdus heterorhabditis subsp. aluminescens]
MMILSFTTYTRYLSSCLLADCTHPGHRVLYDIVLYDIVLYAPGDSLPCRRDTS